MKLIKLSSIVLLLFITIESYSQPRGVLIGHAKSIMDDINKSCDAILRSLSLGSSPRASDVGRLGAEIAQLRDKNDELQSKWFTKKRTKKINKVSFFLQEFMFCIVSLENIDVESITTRTRERQSAPKTWYTMKSQLNRWGNMDNLENELLRITNDQVVSNVDDNGTILLTLLSSVNEGEQISKVVYDEIYEVNSHIIELNSNMVEGIKAIYYQQGYQNLWEVYEQLFLAIENF